MILEHSRYEVADVAQVQGADGEFRPTIQARNPYATWFAFDTYLTRKGDRIDLIAARHLGDPELWWLIAYANPEHLLLDPVPEHVELRIPRVRLR